MRTDGLNIMESLGYMVLTGKDGTGGRQSESMVASKATFNNTSDNPLYTGGSSTYQEAK
jgi:hypothetical protein